MLGRTDSQREKERRLVGRGGRGGQVDGTERKDQLGIVPNNKWFCQILEVRSLFDQKALIEIESGRVLVGELSVG